MFRTSLVVSAVLALLFSSPMAPMAAAGGSGNAAQTAAQHDDNPCC